MLSTWQQHGGVAPAVNANLLLCTGEGGKEKAAKMVIQSILPARFKL